MAEPAAGPIQRAAPGTGAGAGVAGGAVPAGAVGCIIEWGRLECAAHPAGRRSRSLALVAREAGRRRRVAGEVEAAAGPRSERSTVTGQAFTGCDRMIELHAR